MPAAFVGATGHSGTQEAESWVVPCLPVLLQTLWRALWFAENFLLSLKDEITSLRLYHHLATLPLGNEPLISKDPWGTLATTEIKRYGGACTV